MFKFRIIGVGSLCATRLRPMQLNAMYLGFVLCASILAHIEQVKQKASWNIVYPCLLSCLLVVCLLHNTAHGGRGSQQLFSGTLQRRNTVLIARYVLKLCNRGPVSRAQQNTCRMGIFLASDRRIADRRSSALLNRNLEQPASHCCQGKCGGGCPSVWKSIDL